jgi:hypothetical protein
MNLNGKGQRSTDENMTKGVKKKILRRFPASPELLPHRLGCVSTIGVTSPLHSLRSRRRLIESVVTAAPNLSVCEHRLFSSSFALASCRSRV